MSKKYIKLSFESAKLFPKNIRTKDFTSRLETTKKGKLYFKRIRRSDLEEVNFVEPITVHQISNMLHTLVGKRPIPSFRMTYYDRDEQIFNIANNSLLKINTPKVFKKIKDSIHETYIEEFIRVNKSANDSWRKPQTIQWFKVEKMMGNHFNEFITIINDELGYDVLSKPFESLLNMDNKCGGKLIKTLKFLTEKKKTPIVNFLTRETMDRSEITKSTLLGETINSGIDVMYVLDGEILVPYEEEFVNRLIKSATNILDGGYVEIIGVFHEDELYDTQEFRLVSQITDKKH